MQNLAIGILLAGQVLSRIKCPTVTGAGDLSCRGWELSAACCGNTAMFKTCRSGIQHSWPKRQKPKLQTSQAKISGLKQCMRSKEQTVPLVSASANELSRPRRSPGNPGGVCDARRHFGSRFKPQRLRAVPNNGSHHHDQCSKPRVRTTSRTRRERRISVFRRS